jgi:putative ABC transport system permease protein
MTATYAMLEQEWKKISPHHRFRAEFFDDAARANFSEALDLVRIVGFFGVIGMVIACLGLLGLTTYTVEAKAKEISIRKVLGADIRDVATWLSKGYFMVFFVSVVVASALSFLLGKQMLQTFADRISLSVLLFLPGIGFLLIMMMLTIGSQALRAALSNPVESLRSE